LGIEVVGIGAFELQQLGQLGNLAVEPGQGRVASLDFLAGKTGST
jgi:hypothetical protein